MKDYSNLKQLLESQETFPFEYLHKFIGRNTPRFAQGVQALEKRFPALVLQSARMSSGDAHVAMTYRFLAPNADAIIEVLQATDQIEDLLFTL